MGVIKVMALVDVATVLVLLRPNAPGTNLLIVWFNLVTLAACLIYARAASDEIAAEITAAEMSGPGAEPLPQQATLPFDSPRLGLPAGDPLPVDEPFVLKPAAPSPTAAVSDEPLSALDAFLSEADQPQPHTQPQASRQPEPQAQPHPQPQRRRDGHRPPARRAG